MSDAGRLARWNRGATRPGLADVIIVLIVIAILLWASWMQFPAYRRQSASRPTPDAKATPVPLPPPRLAPALVQRHTPLTPR
jgi:hypothetical protein